VYAPAATCRIMPARIIRMCDGTVASAGVCFDVGIKYWLQRIVWLLLQRFIRVQIARMGPARKLRGGEVAGRHPTEVLILTRWRADASFQAFTWA